MPTATRQQPWRSLTVLGGGMAGLAVGSYARQRGLPATIYEARPRPGGLCLTLEHQGFLYDSGAHRFHDKDPDITRDVKALLGEHLRVVDRPSMLFDRGRLMKFPFGLTDALWHLGPAALTRSALEMAAARLAGRQPEPDNFAAFAVRKYGRTVAERFLLNYSQKLWGLPCERLSARVSGGRLNGLDLRQFLLHTVLGRRSNGRHTDGAFYYPTHGIGMLTDALVKSAGPSSIRAGAEVTAVCHDHARVRAVVVDGVGRIAVDAIASTVPLERLAAMMDPPPPQAVLQQARTLTHRDLIVVALLLRKESVTNAATVYFPDSNTPFTRITEPRNRSVAMSPRGHTSLVAEIPCASGDRLWNADDGELVHLVKAPLAEIGWIRDSECLGQQVLRLRRAYPVLSVDVEDTVGAVLRYFGGFDNLMLAGRGGRFEYGWIHDVLRDGKQIVDSCLPRAAGARPAPARSLR
jgi:protoporphyrinogen oxidase